MQPVSWHHFREKAISGPRQKIILADGTDARVIRAAATAKQEHLADPILIGPRRSIEPLWKSLTTEPLELFDFDAIPEMERRAYTEFLCSLPKFKSLTPEESLARSADPLVQGCLHLRMGKSQGFIGGATRTTADTLRAVFSIIGLAPRTSALFGFFLLERRVAVPGDCPLVLLADCAVIPDPSPKQLAHIALGAAEAYTFFTGENSRVAFLSFSTAGSADHPAILRVQQARDMAREKNPRLAIEGEWQADAALDEFVAGIKGVGSSPMAGRANVLIAPDLNTGNIAYKLAQRLGGCRAVGPILWGTHLPANDLSRGCSTEDVLDMIALTVLQAQHSSQSSAQFQKQAV